jgi:hypothetical protein
MYIYICIYVYYIYVYIRFRYFFNWAMFAAPRHIVIKKSLEYSIQLIKREYFGNSGVKIYLNDHLGKLLQCTTTMTLTHVARELVLLETPELGLRVGGTNFVEYGGVMKAWYNDQLPNQ